MKTCTRCGTDKPAGEFYRKAASADGLFPYCKECERSRRAQYRSDNPEKVAAQKAAYYASHIDKIAERNARRYAEKRGEILSQKAEYRKARRAEAVEYAVRHRAERPHVAWASTYRSRCRRLGIAPLVEGFTKDDVVDSYGSDCFYCGGEFQELDHYVPVSKGGPHTLDNVRPCCTSCNASKFTMPGDEWLADEAADLDYDRRTR